MLLLPEFTVQGKSTMSLFTFAWYSLLLLYRIQRNLKMSLMKWYIFWNKQITGIILKWNLLLEEWVAFLKAAFTLTNAIGSKNNFLQFRIVGKATLYCLWCWFREMAFTSLVPEPTLSLNFSFTDKVFLIFVKNNCKSAC